MRLLFHLVILCIHLLSLRYVLHVMRSVDIDLREWTSTSLDVGNVDVDPRLARDTRCWVIDSLLSP